KGLVATNYHVVSDAVKAEVVFNDGTRFGVEGYVALNPQTDLCVLKLNGVPPNAKALQLVTAAGPRDASKVYAIGHPYNYEFTTTDGIVGRVMHTAQFPADTREWLKESLQGEPDNVWIQHSAKISPGNSGGPLINSAGDVVGVNSWINEKLDFGYAIHSKHLQDLMNQESPTVTLLKDKRRVLHDNPQGQLAQSPITSEHLQKLAADLSARRWSPKNAEDFASLDSLAFAMTIVRFIQSGADVKVPMPAEEQLALVQVVDQIIDTLRKTNWQDNEQILPINAHASKPRRRSEGVFLFGIVKQRAIAEGEHGWLMELKGNNRLFFMPSEGGDAEFKPGDCVLVLGITGEGGIRFGEDRPRSILASVVVSKVAIKVADGAPGMSGQVMPGVGQGGMPPPGMRPGSRNRPGSRRPGSIPRGTN
ncbi:MAG TPA: serine protease, partial [Pirellulales bacterium]